MTQPFDMILVNARIATGEPSRPWVTGLGVRDGVLVAVGAAAEILKVVGPATVVIDGKGEELAIPAGVAVGKRVRVSTGDGGVKISAEEDV